MTDTSALLSAVNDYALTTIFSVEEAKIVQSFTEMLMKRLTNEIDMCILSVVRNDLQEGDITECKHERGSMVTENGQEWFVCKHCHKKYERYF